MQVRIARRLSRRPGWGAIYGGLVIVGLVTVRFLHPLLRLAPPCTFYALTGLPCPSCGATRSAVFLAEGHWLDSLRVNPLFFGAYVALLLWAFAALSLAVSNRELRVTMSKWEKRALRIAAAVVVIANWLYLVLSHAVEHYSL